MNASDQKRLVLVGSLSLTALLVGSVVGGLAVWRTVSKQLKDAEFLQKQLAIVAPDSGGPDAGAASALVRVSVAERKPIHPQRTIIGRLVEVRKVTVASEVTGNIVDMPVEEGTPVTGGKTVLAKVDDVWCRLAGEQGRAEVASAEAKLKFENLELKRFEELTDRSAISQSDLESKQATVAELQATLDETKAALEEQDERITRSAIVAPFDGVVVAKHAELGGHVTLGTPIVDVVSRGEVDALLMVPELMINLITVGQDLPIWIDPLASEVEGKVVSVTPYGPTASRTFPVRVRLDDEGGRLKVGMSVTASIPTGPEREALMVMRDAVLVRPDGSTVWITLPKDDADVRRGSPDPAGKKPQADASAGSGDPRRTVQFEVQPVPVSVTARMEDEYAVEPETDKGRKLLVSGATVVIEGAERLTAGQEVRVVTLPDAARSGPPQSVAAQQAAG